MTYASLAVFTLCSGAVYAQDPSDDPFGGGFPVNYKAEVLTMGAQNDSLHSWAYGWLSGGVDSLELTGDGSFPESYQCGENRDIAHGDFDGDYVDELVVVWNRADGGVFVGIPSIDPATLAPDPGGWNLPNDAIDPGVLYAAPVLADILGEVRVVAGNFYDDRAEEFVLAYLAADSTVTLTVFDWDSDVDSLTAMASISDQAVNTALPELQQFGAVSRFDIATGDFDGDGLDEIALIVNDPDESPATHLALNIYKFDTVANTLNPTSVSPIAYAANADIDHPCLRSVLIETGNFEPDSLDEIAILDSWSRSDVDSSRVGTLHTLKLNSLMTAIDDFQMQSLPPCSWQSDANGPNGMVHIMTTYNDKLIVGGEFTAVGGLAASNIASWDSTGWKPLGAGVNGRVEALEIYDGDLIVGGAFHEAGGVPANHLARWDGSSWEPFGTGADDTVFDLLVTSSEFAGCRLFACGDFSTIGGVFARGIARYDGSAWHTVGSDDGLNARPLEMMELSDRIVVTGKFTFPTIDSWYIAYWLPSDPASWHYYGKGLLLDGAYYEGWGHALEYDRNGQVIAGGNFTHVWGYIWPLAQWRLANNLGIYDGSYWHPIGLNPPGADTYVYDLLFDPVYDSLLYAGGVFLNVQGISANKIARWHWPSGPWVSLGTGVTADAGGYAQVRKMCFYDDELIVGGQFDHAGGIDARNIARYNRNYAEWHALSRSDSLPPVFAVGLAVGKFDSNSELDDIAITACASDMGDFRQFVRVYGVDTSASPLTLSERGETNLSGYWTDSELARSRRLIAIDDITGDGQADLVVLTSKSLNSRIEIYEPCDIFDDCTFDPMPQAGSWDSGSVNLTQLVLADLDTLTAIIGPPKAYHIDSVLQPLAIINAPPVHYDYIDDSICDISKRYVLPFQENYDAYVEYLNSGSWSITTETVVHRDWGISESLEQWINIGGTGVDGYLESEYGQHFDSQQSYTETITVGQIIEARNKDQVFCLTAHYDILEYPVLHQGELVGHVAVVTPSQVSGLWKAANSWDFIMPNHEVENIFSYPRPEDIQYNPMMASGAIGDLTAFETQDLSGWQWFLGHQTFQNSSVTESWDESIATGSELTLGLQYQVTATANATVLGTGCTFGMNYAVSLGVSQGIEGNYSESQLSTFSTSFSETDSLHLKIGRINTAGEESNNRRYQLTPYAYWAKNGALIIDYAVRPNTEIEETWWQLHYSDPDPAFILPWRFVNEKEGASEPEESRHKTKEVFFYPSYPEPGDSMVIAARVHNFSLTDILDPVAVSFYLGNPDNGGLLLHDKNSNDSIFYTRDTSGTLVGIDAQGNAFVTMMWQVPIGDEITSCQRIWALIDPLDEISPEVHDNGDWATNNKGWNLLHVNTTNDCYDPDGDKWVASAYRCCDDPNYYYWDNCPDVYNPNQEDSDGDDIGDSCDVVVVVYMCGDANGDMQVNVGDAVFVINYVFKGGQAPNPLCAGDANGDVQCNVGDAVYLIAYVFKGGPAPTGACCP